MLVLAALALHVLLCLNYSAINTRSDSAPLRPLKHLSATQHVPALGSPLTLASGVLGQAPSAPSRPASLTSCLKLSPAIAAQHHLSLHCRSRRESM
jgi:hypothetical protein